MIDPNRVSFYPVWGISVIDISVQKQVNHVMESKYLTIQKKIENIIQGVQSFVEIITKFFNNKYSFRVVVVVFLFFFMKCENNYYFFIVLCSIKNCKKLLKSSF